MVGPDVGPVEGFVPGISGGRRRGCGSGRGEVVIGGGEALAEEIEEVFASVAGGDGD